MSKDLPNKKLVKIGDAAQLLGVSVDTLRRWEKTGKINVIRTPGGTRLYSIDKIHNFNQKPEPQIELVEQKTQFGPSQSPFKKSSDANPNNLPTSQMLDQSLSRTSPENPYHWYAEKSNDTEDKLDTLGYSISEIEQLTKASSEIYARPQIYAKSPKLSLSHFNIRKFNTPILGSSVIILLIIGFISLLYFYSPELPKTFFQSQNPLSHNPLSYLTRITLSPFNNVAQGLIKNFFPQQAIKIGLITDQPSLNTNSVDSVLAASSIAESNQYLQINADTQITNNLAVEGQSIFKENITAPNIIYGLVAGNNITITQSQTPTISVSLPNLVSQLTGTSVPSTLGGTGTTTYTKGDILYASATNTLSKLIIGNNGQVLKVSSGVPAWGTDNTGGSMSSFTIAGSSGTSQTVSDGNTLTIVAGNGISTTATSGPQVTVGLNLTASGVAATSTTTSGSGLETSSGLTLLRGCTNSQVLSWDSTNLRWQCTTTSGSVSSVSNSDGTLTISPTTGAVVASLALGHANTWTNTQTFSNASPITLSSTSPAIAIGNTGTLTITDGTNTLLSLADNGTTGTLTVNTLAVTNVGAYTLTGNITGSGSPTLSGLGAVTSTGASSFGSISLTTALTVGNGGTGATTSQGAINAISQLTTNGDVLYNDGTNSTRLARGSNGQCLTANTTTILWASCNGTSGVTTSPGNGTSGQIAFFTGSTTITSESSGFGWDTTNKLFTLTGASGNTTQTTEAITSSAQGLTSGGLLSAALTSSSATASYTGNIGSFSSTRTNATNSQSLTDSGNILALTRSETVNATTPTTTVSGNVLNISDTGTATSGTITWTGATAALTRNCSGAGTCTDSGNVLSLTQSFSSATGAVLNVSNAGSGNAINIAGAGTRTINSSSGNLTIQTVTSGALALTSVGALNLTGAAASTWSLGANPLTITSSGATFNTSTSTDDQITISPATGGAGRFTGTITSADLTASGNWSFPNAYGTICISGQVCAASGTVGYWSRSGTTLSPTTANDIVTISTVPSGSTGLTVTTAAVTSGTTTAVAGTTGTITTAGTQNSFLGTLGAISAGTANGYNLSTSAPTGGTINGVNIQAIAGSGTTINGVNIGNNTTTSGTVTGVNIGTISGATTVGTAIATGAISSTGASNAGISLSTLTGGTSTNYQITTGTLTSIASSTDYHLNLGTTVGASSATFGGVNIGAISGAGTQSAGINIGANTSTATTNYGVNVGAITGAGTNNYGLRINGSSGSTNNYGVYSQTNWGSTSYAGYFDGNIANLASSTSPGTTHLGTVATGTAPSSLFVQGRYAYVVNNNAASSRLQIFDVTTPSSPASISTTNVGSDINSDLSDIYVSGRYAYITDYAANGGVGRFYVYDISNPTSPTQLSGVAPAGLFGPFSVFVSGKYAYIGNSTGSGLIVMDVSNPNSPVQVGVTGSSFVNQKSLFIQGQYAYYVNTSGDSSISDFQVWDMSNPALPVQRSDTNISTLCTVGNAAGPRVVYVQGRYAYVACTHTSLHPDIVLTIDISDPTSTSTAGSRINAISVGSGSRPSSVWVSGRYLYIFGQGTSRIYVYDVVNPNSPVSVSSQTVTDTGGGVIFGSGKYLYAIASTNATLRIYDASGTETTSLLAHSLEAGTLQVQGNAIVDNQLQAMGLGVGAGGIFSAGDVGFYGSLTGTGITPASVAAATGTSANTVLSITGGNGGTISGSSTNSAGGVGGGFSLTAGTGGANPGSTGTSTRAGGAGGAYTYTGGAGGSALNFTNVTTAGGAGGAYTVTAGTGGQATTTLSSTVTGGAGGALSLTSGTGGGAVFNANQTATAGAGGTLSITAGTGGAANTGSSTGTRTGGAGGNLTLTGGTGGAASGGAANTGGAGGNVTITGGDASANGNVNGGSITLNSGAIAGTGTSTINLGTSNTTAIALGNLTSNPTLTFSSSGTIRGTNVVTGGNSSSPLLSLEGNGFTAAATNTTGAFRMQTIPTNATTAKIMFSVTGFVATANVFSIDQAGNIRSAGTDTNSVAPDIAENIPVSDQSIEAADVVTVDPGSSGTGAAEQIYHGNLYDVFAAKKSSKPYDDKVLGVISTEPGVILHAPKDAIDSGKSSADGHRLLTLAGRVPVKVSTENGPIQRGDFLTSSSIPGVAMKATHSGQTIGKALENYSGAATGKILTFVTLGYNDPTNVLANMTLDSDGSLIVPKLKVGSITIDPSLIANLQQQNGQLAANLTSQSISFVERIQAIADAQVSQENRVRSLESQTAVLGEKIASQSAQLADISGKETSNSSALDSLRAELDKLSSSKTASSSAQTVNLTPAEALFATGSAKLADLKVDNQISTLKLETIEATVSATFKSLGNTFLGNTTVAGDLTQDGTLSISSGHTINALPTLYLQSSALAEKVDIFNGLVTIDKSGLLKAKTISADQIKLTKGKAVGQGLLPAGNTQITINNSLVEEDSLVILTPETSVYQSLAVTSKLKGQGFVVTVQNPEQHDIRFSYIIVGQNPGIE